MIIGCRMPATCTFCLCSVVNTRLEHGAFVDEVSFLVTIDWKRHARLVVCAFIASCYF